MAPSGRVFWIERFAVHDGPGIRVAVFLKGCPLRCLWCHSPESQSAAPEQVFKADRCIRELCAECSVEVCPTGALTMAGREITVSDLIAEVMKDRVFFERSGGGVTFSGGEPLMQPAFLAEAIDACRAEGVHTVVETSGYGTAQALDAAARADLVLFDLKLFDTERHRRATGVSNRRILDNFARLTARHSAVRVRVPLIPGINDDADNLDAIGALAASAGVAGIDLLPYHTAGSAKYARLDRPYALAGLMPPSPALIAAAGERLARFGATVHIGG